jgi:hypothetical protein
MYCRILLARASDVPQVLAQQFYRRIAMGSSAALVRHVARILTISEFTPCGDVTQIT